MTADLIATYLSAFGRMARRL
ncbi:hypothetical protein E2C01_061488 [Portunus trituberculatus]|uniref:Uncharacterized protein n=1 Tax=Portunus trituberculatus TaxID=210409 RepID=A0A5B7HCJ2_PORTR|nr:hypothetical protein [Portunus trituberculatus]